VLAACRRPTSQLKALGVEIIDGVELTSDASMDRLAEAVADARLDVLVCNAAVNSDPPISGIDGIDVTAMAEAFDVNVLGVMRTVLACLPAMSWGGKIMLVGIGANAFNTGQRLTGSHSYGYRSSKAALVSIGFGLGRDLRDAGIAVVIASPGPVQTDMLRNSQAVTSNRYEDAADPMEVGRQFRARLDELTLDESAAWQQHPTGEPVQFSLG
jgi:NAD(P)-dependent dehydrogenase (short-subunit alcohol dehydrogenase family)